MMPSKFDVSQEYCFPCKFHAQRMWKSGQHPIYHMYCEHPSQITERPLHSDVGRLIGENDENRPQWCPIRGNAEAEREAGD